MFQPNDFAEDLKGRVEQYIDIRMGHKCLNMHPNSLCRVLFHVL